MVSASGSTALRVRMCFPPRLGDLATDGRKLCGDALRMSAADNVVRRYNRLERKSRREVGAEFGTELAQLGSGKCRERAALLETIPHHHSHALVGLAERHAFADQIHRCGERVHSAGIGGSAHPAEIE